MGFTNILCLFSNAQGTIMSNNHILDIFLYNVWYVRTWEMKLWGSVYSFLSKYLWSTMVLTGMMGVVVYWFHQVPKLGYNPYHLVPKMGGVRVVFNMTS